ncbi:MAG: GC-type dockerin domain-anchored protein [Phycisphaerales bacterium]
MRLALLAAAVAGIPSLALAQPYHYAVNQPNSTLSYNISFTAPFRTSPAASSYIVGTRAGADAIPGNADDVVPPAAGTRTVPGIVGGDTNGNTIINLNSGSLAASGTNGSTVYHPSGAFDASFDTTAGTVSVSNLVSSLLGGGTASIDATAVINYPTFREREPTCTIFGVGNISVPVGSISATAIDAAQTGGPASGTLTPINGQPGHYTFSASVPAIVTVTATLSGAPAPIDPQPVTLAITGSVDMTQPGVPVTAQISVDQTQTAPDPLALDPLPFTEPLCQGTLTIKLTLASTSTHIGMTANLAAAGTLAACGPADIGRQGGLPGSDSHLDNNDFIAFINYFFNHDSHADQGIQGGLPGHDGAYDNNDFIAFINHFFAGC